MRTPARAARRASTVRRRSSHAAALFTDLMGMPVELRREFTADLSEEDWRQVLAIAELEGGTPYALWRDDPCGFVTDVLGETLWSRQRQILEAMIRYKRIAVPAGFGIGKTWIAARAVAHFACVYPVGTSTAVTTATRMRQVHRQLWPHVRRMVARAGLPGECDTTQWRIPDTHGVDTVVAYGFSAPAHDEAAMQGIHAARLLLVVDEAGGIGRMIGQATRNLLTGDARMLAIGNPPTDDEGSWFEGLCEAGEDPARPDTITIRIPATASPAVTGEHAGVCRDCPPGAGEHQLAIHLVDQDWIDDAVGDHGEAAPYVVAKVHARFPRGGGDRAIPAAWVDNAVELVEPAAPTGHVRLCDLALPEMGEPALAALNERDLLVPVGGWVRLGVDVAADGGDELVIARCVGDLVTIEHVSSGAANTHSVTVAGVILTHIHAAQALAAALGSPARVRVKLDAIGVGWGVAGVLEAWGTEQRHDADIVRVVVSESPEHRDEDPTVLRPRLKRDEMWLAGRSLLQPELRGGRSRLRLAVDGKTAGQLSTPRRTYTTGYTVIESKKSLRARGVASPDRAEACLLTVYEPYPLELPRRLIV